MALELEERLGRGLDVEWAIGALASQPGADALFALQARPITVAPRPASGGQLTASPAVPSGIDLALGLASAGPAGPGGPGNDRACGCSRPRVPMTGTEEGEQR